MAIPQDSDCPSAGHSSEEGGRGELSWDLHLRLMTWGFLTVVSSLIWFSLLSGREVLAYELMMYVRFAKGTIVEIHGLAIPSSDLLDGTTFP